MAIHNTLCDLFTNIANAIRSKTGSTQPIVADNFPTEIANLRTGFDYVNQNVTSISDYEFYNCTDLKSVDCSNLTSIGTSAFEGCSELKAVTLYEGVTDVGENAFKGCNCIIYCMFDSQPESWVNNWNPDNCLVLFGDPIETWDISAAEADDVTAELYTSNDGYALFVYGNGHMNDFAGSNGTPWRDYKSDITSITISDGVTSIGNSAFYGYTSLASITISDGVTSIGNSAFYKCSSLTSIAMPESVVSIGDYAFSGCSSLTSITIPDGVTSIGSRAFSNCSNLTSITIPDSVTGVGDSVFSGCSSLKTAGPIGGGYDYEFGWTDTIPSYAFEDCSSLTSITIPDGVTSIGKGTFWYCSSLTSITIPDSVTSIGSDAFSGCSSLKTAGPIGGGYDYEFGWTDTIPGYTFWYCSSLTSITIPDGVTSIGDSAFEYCSSLTSITIPDSVTSIGNAAFSGCSSLTSITIPDSVTSIGKDTFWYCSSLTSITIPDSVTSIGSNAFQNCSKLTSITIPDSVNVIRSYAFWGCSSLTSIIYSGTVSKWDTIGFGTEWDLETPDYIIHCTDGDIAKDGTITYHTME